MGHRICALVIGFSAACGSTTPKPDPVGTPISDEALARELAVLLAKACPPAAPDDRAAENPHLAELDRACRDLEAEMRPHQCASCHDPGNASDMNPLTILTYPNQALVARRAIREQIEQAMMPPEGEREPAR
jgi:hypothetical protein